MFSQSIIILGLLVNTIVVDNTNDPMVSAGEVYAPVIVRINGTIREGLANEFASEMQEAQQTGQSVIPIVISSYGGSVYALFKMIDIINKVKETTPVATIVIGKAMSAGAVLLSCGTEGMRWISPSATVMIHEVSAGASGKAGEIKSNAAEVDRLNKMLLEVISTNIGKDSGYIAGIVHSEGHADWYLTPEDALEHNLVNKIGIPDLKMKVTVTTTLE